MGNIQISRPVVIALVAAILAGGFVLYKNHSSSNSAGPPPPSVATATGKTGSTGSTGASGKAGASHKHPAHAATGSTGKAGATGATGATAAAGGGATSSTGADTADVALKQQADEAGIPLSVYKARRTGKTIIIFFATKNGPDDALVAQAIEKVVQERKNVRVFVDTLSHQGRYDGIAQAAQITQTPGLVLVYRSKATTWQGYVDDGTLDQMLSRLTGRGH